MFKFAKKTIIIINIIIIVISFSHHPLESKLPKFTRIEAVRTLICHSILFCFNSVKQRENELGETHISAAFGLHHLAELLNEAEI